MKISDGKTNFLICLTIFAGLLLIVFGIVFGVIYAFNLVVDVGLTSLICLIIVIILLIVIISQDELEALLIIIVVFFVLLVIINGIAQNFVVGLTITLILTLILVVFIMTRMSGA